MSRTDKTAPFWVKLMRGDLASQEFHNHADGVCDLPPVDHATAWDWSASTCHRSFVYTGIHTCCCKLCHSSDEYMTRPQKRRRMEGKRLCRNWEQEYGHYGWDGCLGNGQYCERCLDDYAYDEEGYW